MDERIADCKRLSQARVIGFKL